MSPSAILFPEIKRIAARVENDSRGFAGTCWTDFLFHSSEFVARQGFMSHSHAGVIRGMHFQAHQAKVVQVLNGLIFDVVVDIRKYSATRGRYMVSVMDERDIIFVPPGFAHGFVAAEDSVLYYLYSQSYDRWRSRTLLWNDPDVGIPWHDLYQPSPIYILSDKDRNGTLLKDVEE